MEGFLINFIHGVDEGDYLEKLVDDMLQGRITPHTATLEITNRFVSNLHQLQGSSATESNPGS